MKCHSCQMFFEVIANKTRLKIINLLLDGSKCVSEICEGIGEEQSKVSHNLRILTQCHFVERKVEGKKRVYTLNKRTIRPLMKIVNKHVSLHCSDNCQVKK